MSALRKAQPEAADAVRTADAARAILDDAPLSGAYRRAVTAALELPGNVLSRRPDLRWARLVWTCCAAAGGERGQALDAAVAVELFMVGLDLLDDAEDGEGDSLTAALGSARALNVSTGLLCLGQRALLHSAGGAEAVGVLLQATARACAGQHADLDIGRPATALDEALTIAAEKSGSLTAAACRIGALAAGVAPARQEAYARFGTYLGLVAQLLNDIAATHPDAIDKTDIALARPTLPLAYGGQQSPSGSAATVAGGPWGEGAYFAWAVADAYRRRALALIPDLADTSGGRADLAALLPQC